MGTRLEAGVARHRTLGLSYEDLVAMYRTMVTARLCDEAQFRLNRQGRAPFVVPVSGHEGCQIGTAWAMERGKDVLVPYYRDMAACLVFGLTPYDVFLGVFGKPEDPSSGGRQMPAHWSSRKNNIITGSSPIATQIPQAAGDLGVREQPLRHLGPALQADGRETGLGARGGIRVPRRDGGRERRARLLRGHEGGRGPRSRRRRAHTHRGHGLPLPPPHLGRPRPHVPNARGGRGC